MRAIAGLTTLLMFIYAGILSFAAADRERLDNPINILLVLLAIAFVIGGICFTYYVITVPIP